MFLKRFSPGKSDSYLLSKKVSQIKARIVIYLPFQAYWLLFVTRHRRFLPQKKNTWEESVDLSDVSDSECTSPSLQCLPDCVATAIGDHDGRMSEIQQLLHSLPRQPKLAWELSLRALTLTFVHTWNIPSERLHLHARRSPCTACFSRVVLFFFR